MSWERLSITVGVRTIRGISPCRDYLSVTVDIYFKPIPMNKKEAAEYLGVSTRAIERYTQKGLISVKYEGGKTRPVAVYDSEELDKLKEELETTIYKPAIESSSPTSTNLATSDVSLSGLVEKLFIPLSHQLALLTEAIKNLQTFPTAPSAVKIENKLLLTLREVQALTGLSREILREAIEQGQLKAQIIGKAWRVKRQDLEEYIENL
jgi:excisionase family DNA binding protein